ncbi:MAG: murein L,D-transpeptidase catalytic domain family protein [Gammaproteobacteria bacterium]|nr:murein L,D-transpeptidase catalytic domain family protein [Gammaproteobacteria bacterium]
MKTILITLSVSSLICAALFAPSARANETAKQVQAATAQSTEKSSTGVPPQALKYAINAYRWAVKNHKVNNPSVLTIVDFSRPSFEQRLWVIDLKNDRVLMRMHVAQGKNTGAIYATRFSNQAGSLESSPGVFTTTSSKYFGEHGESLRVRGLEAGINNNAYNRAVVIHAASYVTPDFIKQNGYAGRSWGCFAVNPAHVDKLIDLVKGGSVLFAYATPEKDDSRVDHQLSSNGEELYDAILHKSTSWFS